MNDEDIKKEKGKQRKEKAIKIVGSVVIVIVVALVVVFRMISCAGCVSRNVNRLSSQSQQTEKNIDPNNVKLNSTPDSTCFSKIGYDSSAELLVVVFRDSGSKYAYYEFPESEWKTFNNADSLGGYYNSYIKGNYKSEKIE